MSGAKGLMMVVEFVKKLGKVVVYAAVGATILTALLVITGLVNWAPSPYLVWIDFSIPRWVTAWFGLFLNLVLVAIIYTFFGPKIVELLKKGWELYQKLPPAGKALIAGIPFALIAGLAIAATHLLATALSIVVRFVLPLVTWLVVSAASFVHLRSADDLGTLLTRFSMGTAVGFAFAAIAIMFDRFVGAVSLPGYLPLVVLFLTAPLAATILVRSAQREDGGYLSALLVATGFAQVSKIKTLTVAVALGLLVAIMAALLVSAIITDLLVTILLFVFVWVFATLAGLRWFQRTDVAYGDLVIVGVQERSSGDRRELTVTNRRDERVDLRNAKIRDTEYDLYRTNIDVLLGPGQTETFDIPPGFSLFPSTDNLANDLPLGFSVSQSADAPVIVTRDGQKFKLRWDDGVAEAAGYADATQQTRPRDADRREDNA